MCLPGWGFAQFPGQCNAAQERDLPEKGCVDKLLPAQRTHLLLPAPHDHPNAHQQAHLVQFRLAGAFLSIRSLMPSPRCSEAPPHAAIYLVYQYMYYITQT